MVKVLKSGFYSSIQDFGRLGFQDYGVPYSGVMDRCAASMANALLGNNENEAVIEMTMTGAILQFECETLICLSGAHMNPKLNGLLIQNNKVTKVNKNDVLSFGKLESGFRCYLAIFAGFETEVIMSSRSMYKAITPKFHLQKGDNLTVRRCSFSKVKHHARLKIDNSYLNTSIIDVFKGPEFNLLSSEQQEKLLANPFTISKENNRMAYQLKEPLENNLDAIITSAVLPGTVQLTPSGKLIILMRDCQTTGGYPRVLQLKESSIDVLSQKFAGQTCYFRFVN